MNYADWIKERLVNRTDFYNRFFVQDRPLYVANPQYLTERNLTDDIVARAASGEIVVALFSVGQAGSKWAVIDFDDHRGDQPVDQLAHDAYEKLKPYSPLLERTGRGYHVWILFDSPVEPEVATEFIKPYAPAGTELMPGGRYDRWPKMGTAVAIPSRHRFLNVNNALWDGAKWIEFGTPEFVEFITSFKGVDAGLPKVQLASRGLGDTIAKMTSAVGIKPCGGCKKRQEKLNDLFPYKGAT